MPLDYSYLKEKYQPNPKVVFLPWIFVDILGKEYVRAEDAGEVFK